MASKAKILKSQSPAKHKVQEHHRCFLCGRPRGYMRKFGLCRICFRILAHQGKLPGVRKSSW